jgi:hypothetical protein
MMNLASEAGIWVPPQRIGDIDHIKRLPLTRGSLDAYAHVLDPDSLVADASLLVEVKNIHRWIYPWTKE